MLRLALHCTLSMMVAAAAACLLHRLCMLHWPSHPAGQLPRDLEIRWNARLLTTAGLTHYKREIPDDPYAPPM